jgi:transcriptional regulator with XRE-family HTH domain
MDDRTIWKLKRISKKITLQQIAKALGISVPYLSMYENGKANLSTDIRNKYKNYIEEYDQ